MFHIRNLLRWPSAVILPHKLGQHYSNLFLAFANLSPEPQCFVTASQGKRTADDEMFLDPLNKANKNIKLLATESQA